ncbi:hypothetical protein ONZ45_g12676 [Pleurotus djamor]|nr:hypothetical protein ONZ45_g12676 [Pleurotus djamor]
MNTPMDGYDEKGARQFIEQVSLVRREGTRAPTNGGEKYQFAKDTAKTWRLCADMTTYAEATLAIQGTIIDVSLPPFSRFIKRKEPTNQSLLMLRQSVRITGFGGTLFDESMEEIHEIHALFASSNDSAMQAIDFISKGADDSLVFTASNRFFTPNAQSQTTTKSIETWMDPHGHLANANGKGGSYTEENEVEYFKANVSEEAWSFENVQGDCFRRGDIVEVRVGFIVIDTTEGKVLKAVLRSICLLNNTFTKVKASSSRETLLISDQQKALIAASKAATNLRQKADNKKVVIKRSRGYEAVDIRAINAGVKLLKLTQEPANELRGDTVMENTEK